MNVSKYGRIPSVRENKNEEKIFDHDMLFLGLKKRQRLKEKETTKKEKSIKEEKSDKKKGKRIRR